MTEEGASTGAQDAATAAPVIPAPPTGQPPAPAYGSSPAVPAGGGPLGRTRGTGKCILLAIVTFGIYPIVWYYKVHDELKQHRGSGLGGGLALVLAIFVGIAMPYVTASEVGDAYAERGLPKPVSGLTGLWYFPGSLLLVGPIVWFVKTNGAINEYWRSLGAA
jgi:hypothetical protein